MRIGDRIERVNVLDIEASGYALLGATPLLGRLLDARDGGVPSVMVNHRLWRRHLNADRRVIGQRIRLSGDDYTVVGVLPPGFDFELISSASARRTFRSSCPPSRCSFWRPAWQR